MSTRGRSLALLLLLLPLILAGESCCQRKARLAKLQFIPDEDASPPAIDSAGNPRLIPNATEIKPSGWDDDDDGPWEPADIPNPLYTWTPPLKPNPDYAPPSFREELTSEIFKALPWVVLGVIITASLDAIQLPIRHTLSGLLRGAGPLGGAFIGLATPLCSCGALPVAAGFVANGVPLGAVASFLIASQSAGLDSAAITWGLLGPTATAWRLGGAAILATVAGLVAGGFGGTAAKASKPPPPKAKSGTGGEEEERFKFHRALGRSAVSSASEAFPPVLIGLALSTAATYFMPYLNAPEVHADLLANASATAAEDGSSAARALLVRTGVLAAALPLQLCEHSTVTLAAGVQKAGGGAGLAFALLLAAPAINLPSLLLIASAKGEKSARYAAARVAVALTISALLLSYVVDAAGVDLLVAHDADLGGMTELPKPLVDASPWVAGLLTFAAVLQAASKRWAMRKAQAAVPGPRTRSRSAAESCCMPCAPKGGSVLDGKKEK